MVNICGVTHAERCVARALVGAVTIPSCCCGRTRSCLTPFLVGDRCACTPRIRAWCAPLTITGFDETVDHILINLEAFGAEHMDGASCCDPEALTAPRRIGVAANRMRASTARRKR
jgi:hypothetical protein